MNADSLLNGTMILRLVAVLALVVGMIFVATWIARRIRFGASGSAAAKLRRLSVQEVRPLDGHRRLVIVRRDDVEHLLLIGGGNDVVVETGIPVQTSREDPLERVHFRDVLPKGKSDARILRPGIRDDGDFR